MRVDTYVDYENAVRPEPVNRPVSSAEGAARYARIPSRGTDGAGS